MHRRRSVVVGFVLVIGSVAGCATPTFETFPDALHACRLMQPGRMTRKTKLPPTQPSVAACLERHGWRPDGGQTELAAATR
jgi:hypothetical protein